MDEGRFLILNLGKVFDDVTRKILGATLMVLIEQAARSRAGLEDHEITQHTLIVDEWPTFAATETTLQEILSQARKFGLNIYLACQSLGQISGKRLDAAFENCRLGMYFSLGQGSAELSSQQIGDLDPYAIKEPAAEGDDRSPTAHDQYLPLKDQIQLWTNELKGLDIRWCYAKLDNAKAVKILTPDMPKPDVDKEELEGVIATYRRLYQRSRSEAERKISSISLPMPSSHDDISPRAIKSAFDWEAGD
jgi:hypothetical protein